MIWYPCPKCGLKESSWDGYRFCGKCETEYQKDEAIRQSLESQ